MKKINNSCLGTFYIEDLENREEQDRVKLFDSDENYLDYLPLERYDDTDPTEEEQYHSYIEMLENFKTIEELLDWLSTNYGFIGNLTELENSEWADVIGTEYMNRIGDVYIAISD